MTSINRRKRLSDIALDTGKKRRRKDKQNTSIDDAGWQPFNLARNSLVMVDTVRETSAGAIFHLPKNSSASVIFPAMLSPDLIERVLARLKIEHQAWFVRSKGGGKLRVLNPSVRDVYKALALRVWLHGPGRSQCSSRSRQKSLSEA